MKPSSWLSDDDYAKARGQLKLNIMSVLNVFKLYGMDIHIAPAAEEITLLAEQYGLRVRGVDIPISRETLDK